MTNEFEKLENALFRAGREMEFPATPPLVARVRADLTRQGATSRAAPAPARGWLRWLVPLAAALVLALVLLFALPNTREAIGQFLGLRGLQIFYVTPTPSPSPTPVSGALASPPPATPAPGATPLRTVTPRPTRTPTIEPFTLCCPASLEEAKRRASFELLLPPGEKPSQVYFQSIFGDGEQVVIVFGDPAKPRYTLYQAQRWVYGKIIGKQIGPQTLLGEAQVDGERALWFSGAPHVVMMLDANGQPIYSSERTVDANTLVWETGNQDFGTIYRLETNMTLEKTVALAESLTPSE